MNGRDGNGYADDPGLVWTRESNWHLRLPKPPEDFPGEASFELTRKEADFLQGRLEERCPGTLLAWLARNGSDEPAANFWDDPNVLGAPDGILGMVELARRFSLHVEGIPLLYNLLVAERRRDTGGQDDGKLIEEYSARLAEWAAREADEAPYEANALWTLVARIGRRLPSLQKQFVESWSQRIADLNPDTVANDLWLRTLVEQRELRLKGSRARLANLNRLEDWNGGVGIGRMDFRWVRVRQFLKDLHRGLAA